MPEYIEREAVLKHKTLIPGFVGEYVSVKNIEETPTADVVEVVRCKDCKYYEPKNSLGTQGICMCGEKEMNYSGEFYPYETDFCSYGKRSDA